MPDNFDELVQAALQQQARWIPKRTEMSERGSNYLRGRLGFVPKPGTPSLADRARIATARPKAMLAIGTPPLPQKVDWRSHNGGNFITPVKDQGQCGSCCAFGSIAVMEAQIQIKNNTPDSGLDLSEAFLWFCIAEAQQGRTCGTSSTSGWSPDDALTGLRDQGTVDDACFPYPSPALPAIPDGECTDTNRCADWQNRIVKIESYAPMQDTNQMKAWLADNGPLVTTFTYYGDFASYDGNGVYNHIVLPGDPPSNEGHCVAVVGYDDAQNAWLIKNSWGSGPPGLDNWGTNGFGWFAYGDVGIDYEMYGVTIT